MTTRFVIHPEIFDAFPGLVVVGAVAHDIDNSTANQQVSIRWEEHWRAAVQHVSAFGNAQSHPRVVPWREQMRSAGASPKKFPTSIEALLRRAGKGGDPFTINPLVDAYNSVSLHHVVPAGGFDLEDLNGDLELRLSRTGDSFTALGETTPMAVPAGEVPYAVDATILARHFVWRQSGHAAIMPETRSVVMISEILGPIMAEKPTIDTEVRSDFVTMLSDCFGVESQPFIMDGSRPERSLV